MKINKPLAALGLVALLSACGGGGGGDAAPNPTATPIAKAEGVYSGTTSGGKVFSSVILEDDSIWSLYGISGPGGTTLVQGFLNGQGTSNNGSYTATGKDYYPLSGALNVVNGSLTATYVPGVNISGTTTSGTASSSFSATTSAVTGFNYNTPIQIAGLAGTWTGSSLFGRTVTMIISGNGNFTIDSGGCPGSGTVTARASGKNIANITYTNNSSLCSPVSLSASGIGVVSTLTDGRLHMIGVITNADKSLGNAIFVTK